MPRRADNPPSAARWPWLSAWSWIPALGLWAAGIGLWVVRFVTLELPQRGWLVDWYIYAAGAEDLLAGSLYQVPLVSPHRAQMAVDNFNLPPGGALTALPFLALPHPVGGLLFVMLNIAAVAGAAVLTARIVGVKWGWVWSGAAFLLFALFRDGQPFVLGNNSPLVLLFVAGSVAACRDDRPKLSGVLLGVAIATKLWPATLLVVLARERRWVALGWAVGVAGLILGGSVWWLGGLKVLGPMASALRHEVEITRQVLLGITWLRENVDWWPAWGGYAMCVALLIIPARGLTGFGLATLAGMAAIPNLWIHYLGSIAFGAVLLVAGLLDRGTWNIGGRARRSASVPPRPADGIPALRVVAAGLLLAGCQATTGETPTSVVLPDALVENACEAAVVARAEHLRDKGPEGAEQLEGEIFANCTHAEFVAANAKMVDGYRYPGDGRSYIGRNCLRLFALYRGSRLCQTR